MSDSATPSAPPAPGAGTPAVSRRARRGSGSFSTAAAPPVRRPVEVVATMALSALVALSAYAGPLLLAGAVAVTSATLALGWHRLLGGPSVRVPSLLLLLVALTACGLLAVTEQDPFLERLPLVVAGGLLLVFLHQLVRRPPRDRLTESVTISASGIALLAMGAALVPLTHTLDGREVLAVAMAALGVAALSDLLVGLGTLHAWQLPIAMLLGGWAGMGVAWASGAPPLGQAALLGFLVAAVSHAVRRVLAPQPFLATFAGQAAAAAASVLAVGVIVYTFARVLVG